MRRYSINRDLKVCRVMRFGFSPILLYIARPVMRFMLKLTPTVKGVEHWHTEIKKDNGLLLRTDVFEPRKKKEALSPCLIYFHGGGFGYSAAPHHKRLAGIYARESGVTVIMPDYRLLPRHPYPAALDDGETICRWVISNAEKLRVDKNRVAVGGDSAGGALAAGICNSWEKFSCIPPKLQMLLYPVTDMKMQTDSMKKYIDTPMWNAKNNRRMWDMYLRGVPAEKRTEASPMDEELPDIIPDTYIETAQFDCLHDEGAAYGDRLAEAGGKVDIAETCGTVHGYDAVLHSRETMKCIKKRIQALKAI